MTAAILQARYPQDLERQADDYGASLLLRNGMSPVLLADALNKLSESHSKSSRVGYLSSYPPTDVRMQRLRILAARSMPDKGLWGNPRHVGVCARPRFRLQSGVMGSGGFWVSDAHESSGPGMTGIPSSNSTFTVIVARGYRFPFECENMFAVLVPWRGSPESQKAQNLLVGCQPTLECDPRRVSREAIDSHEFNRGR